MGFLQIIDFHTDRYDEFMELEKKWEVDSAGTRTSTGGQLYADLSETADADQVLGSFLVSVGIPPNAVPDGLHDRMALYRTVTADRRILIELYIIVEYGTRISEVGRNVMSAVKFAVESMLGTPVVEVNVNVQGVRVTK